MFHHDCQAREEGRPPERIKEVLGLLEKLWTKYPQLRLGQLLVNVDSRFDTNVYFVEDDELEAGLKKVIDRGGFGR